MPPIRLMGGQVVCKDQNSNEPPTKYENRLGDGLEIVLSDGANSLKSIAGGLNKINVSGPKGERWDEDLLASELNRLGRESDN